MSQGVRAKVKFIELKKKLAEKISNVYLISGNDRFLCYKALEQIEKKLALSLPDMNSVVMQGDTVDPREIVESASMFAFGDMYRLVVVKDFNPKVAGAKKSPAESVLDEYIVNPNPQSVLVFFNIDGDEFFKNLRSKLEFVDCSKLELSSLVSVIIADLKKQGVEISQDDAKMLALYCNSDMARIESEMQKLASFAAKSGVITALDIKENVVEDKEYQIFELSELLSKGKKFEALEMVQVLSMHGRSGFSILTPLYNNFRRVLFTAINPEKRDSEIAEALGVKEYAIKMCRAQAKAFTPRKLKKIVDMLAAADKNIKVGKIKEDVAVKTIIIDILEMRG